MLGRIVVAQAKLIRPRYSSSAAAESKDGTNGAPPPSRLVHSRLDAVWPDQSEQLRQYLFEAARHFELIYELPGDGDAPPSESVIPAMLPDTPPDGFRDPAGASVAAPRKASLLCILTYVPQDLFPKLLVRAHRYVRDGSSWFDADTGLRGGAVFVQDDGDGANVAVVSLDKAELTIEVCGPRPTLLRGMLMGCLRKLVASDMKGPEVQIEQTWVFCCSRRSCCDPKALERAMAGRAQVHCGVCEEPLLLDDLRQRELTAERFDAICDGPDKAWEWCGDGGAWRAFDEKSAQQLSDAHEERRTQLQLVIGHNIFNIDLDKMTQTSQSYGTERPIRMTRSGGLPREGSSISVAEKRRWRALAVSMMEGVLAAAAKASSTSGAAAAAAAGTPADQPAVQSMCGELAPPLLWLPQRQRDGNVVLIALSEPDEQRPWWALPHIAFPITLAALASLSGHFRRLVRVARIVGVRGLEQSWAEELEQLLSEAEAIAVGSGAGRQKKRSSRGGGRRSHASAAASAAASASTGAGLSQLPWDELRSCAQAADGIHPVQVPTSVRVRWMCEEDFPLRKRRQLLQRRPWHRPADLLQELRGAWKRLGGDGPAFAAPLPPAAPALVVGVAPTDIRRHQWRRRQWRA